MLEKKYGKSGQVCIVTFALPEAIAGAGSG